MNSQLEGRVAIAVTNLDGLGCNLNYGRNNIGGNILARCEDTMQTSLVIGILEEGDTVRRLARQDQNFSPSGAATSGSGPLEGQRKGVIALGCEDGQALWIGVDESPEDVEWGTVLDGPVEAYPAIGIGDQCSFTAGSADKQTNLVVRGEDTIIPTSGKRHQEGIVAGTILGRDSHRSWAGIDEQLEDAERSTPLNGLMEQNPSVCLGIFGQEGLASRLGEDGHLPLGGEGRGRR